MNFAVPSLRQLEARFTKSTPERSFRHVDTLDEADGVWFLCPLCFAKNNGPVGTHMVAIGFAGKAQPHIYVEGDALWNVAGTSLDDLVLTPSIQTIGGCNWHGFVGSNGIPPGHAG